MDITSVKAILFDKDGTLFDFQRSWSPWATAVIDRLAQDDAQVAQAVADVLGFDIAQGHFSADGFAVSSTPDEQIERLLPIFPNLSGDEILSRMMSKMDVAVPVPVRDLDKADGCIAAALALGVDPAQTVMVGDSLHDLTAGRAAGMRTIGVLTGTASRADLAPWADSVVLDVSEIADFFK